MRPIARCKFVLASESSMLIQDVQSNALLARQPTITDLNTNAANYYIAFFLVWYLELPTK